MAALKHERTKMDTIPEFDRSCGTDANYQHLKHHYLGFVGFLLHGSNPFSPGSARAISWKAGYAAAEKLQGLVCGNSLHEELEQYLKAYNRV